MRSLGYILSLPRFSQTERWQNPIKSYPLRLSMSSVLNAEQNSTVTERAEKGRW
ncbi:hypothetical protein VIBNISFn118_1080001 [Vibrio nigripulchritudo SFn118]|nr:hypothetical protein VIBNISFn118_1080001 [Vibrio nigripulchritudo SFn118]